MKYALSEAIWCFKHPVILLTRGWTSVNIDSEKLKKRKPIVSWTIWYINIFLGTYLGYYLIYSE